MPVRLLRVGGLVCAGWLFCFAAWAADSVATGVAAGDLTVQVENVITGQGEIRVALYQYRQGQNWQEQAVQYARIATIQPGKPVEHTFVGLPFADYAIKLFQDENSNELLDLSDTGLPLEPFAFSRAESQKKRVVHLKDAIIRFDMASQNVVLDMVKIKNP